MDTPRITRAMATRERRITPLLRRIGTVRHADVRRDDDAFLRSNPETVRQINEAIQRLNRGEGIPATLDEIRAMLGLAS